MSDWPTFEEWQDARFPQRRVDLAHRRIAHAAERLRRAHADFGATFERFRRDWLEIRWPR